MIGRLRCLLGRHDWERQSNPELPGKGAVFYICRRCKHERNEYEEAGPGATSGMGGAAG